MGADQDRLPGRIGHVGATARANRRFVEAVLYRYPWRDPPERFGDGRNTHRRFSRRARKGVWRQLFEQFAADADNDHAMLDSTIARAHQHSVGAPKKSWRPARTGFSGRPDQGNRRPW